MGSQLRKKLQKFWCGDGQETAKKLLALDPAYTAHVIQQADNTRNKTFLFEDHWEMERTNEPVVFSGDIDWEFQPADDPEWTYAFNRHTFLLNLAKAYALTQKSEYVDCFCAYITDWIDKIAPTDQTRQTAWRPIEDGLRLANWLQALALLPELPEPIMQKIEASIEVHIEELTQHRADFQRLSNWGVLQDTGRFEAAVACGDRIALNDSIDCLAENLRLQVLQDGVHWEQSPQYHCEVLVCFLHVVLVARRMNVELPEHFAETVHKMATALAYWCKPNGRILCQSDSDDVDARDLLALSAVLFADEELRWFAGLGWNADMLWTMGAEVYAQYCAMQPKKPASFSRAFSDSGNYILRMDDRYMHMHCGCLGSGHGHADMLHVDLFANGEDILIDSGRYTYVDSELRRYLKSPAAHNTVLVDDTDHTTCINSWGYDRIAEPLRSDVRFLEPCEYVSGYHLGYMDKGILQGRKVLFIKPDIWLIFDVFYATGEHSYKQFWHFNPDGKVETIQDGVEYRGKKTEAILRFLPPRGIETSLQNQPLSMEYNRLTEGCCVVNQHRATGFTSMITAISVGPVADRMYFSARMMPVHFMCAGKELPAHKAQAVVLEKGSITHTVIVAHSEVISEVDYLYAYGYSSYGKVLLFNEQYQEGFCVIH